MDRDQETPGIDPLALRIHLLAQKPYRPAANTIRHDGGRLSLSVIRAQQKGAATAGEIARRLLETSPETRSADETNLLDSAQRYLEAEHNVSILRMQFKSQVRGSGKHFETSFESAVNSVIRSDPAAVMLLSDIELSTIKSLIAHHAKLASIEVMAGLASPVDLDVTGLDADSALDVMLSQCEPRRTVDKLAQTVFSRAAIKFSSDEVLAHVRGDLDTFCPLAEILVELGKAKNEFTEVAQAEERAYNDVLAAYAQVRWDEARP